MPSHPLVTQLGFARSEFQRCLEGVPPEDAVRRFKPMNCISWIVGHLANQENAYWVLVAQGREVAPGIAGRADRPGDAGVAMAKRVGRTASTTAGCTATVSKSSSAPRKDQAYSRWM